MTTAADHCAAAGCAKPKQRSSETYCSMHASRLVRHGSLDDPRPTPLDRFFKSVQEDGECWVWIGASTHGYGTFSLKNRKHRAHRWIYEQMRVDIPRGLHLDHLCRRSICVNPWHLEPVTNQVNVLRGTSPLARQAAKKFCIRGHEFTPENTGSDLRGHRYCRVCAKTKHVRAREAQKGKAA